MTSEKLYTKKEAIELVKEDTNVLAAVIAWNQIMSNVKQQDGGWFANEEHIDRMQTAAQNEVINQKKLIARYKEMNN